MGVARNPDSRCPLFLYCPTYVAFDTVSIIPAGDPSNKTGLTLVVSLLAGLPSHQHLASVGQPLRDEALRFFLKQFVEALPDYCLAAVPVAFHSIGPDPRDDCRDPKVLADAGAIPGTSAVQTARPPLRAPPRHWCGPERLRRRGRPRSRACATARLRLRRSRRPGRCDEVEGAERVDVAAIELAVLERLATE